MSDLYHPTWESHLLSLAHEGCPRSSSPVYQSIVDAALLYHAYAYCDLVTAKHSQTFYAATRLLPFAKRRAIRALYAFCRTADNIADCLGDDCAEKLTTWRRRALSPQPPTDDLVATAWAHTRLQYRIPIRYAEQLIDGVARDFHQTRYQTFEELTTYAYAVASTVGLMSMHIIDYTSSDAIPYAIKLGVALQITNILRDVGEDWRAGRVYLPQCELASFGLNEQDIARGSVDERWREFMRFQIARNQQLYAEAMPGIQLLHPDGRFAVAAAAGLYRGILDDIQTHDYDVFHRRAHVSTVGKLKRLLGIWWRNR